MNRQLTLDAVTDARVIADHAEQMAHEVRRTVEAAKAIVDDVETFYKAVISPLVEWLKSEPAGPSAKVRVVLSTGGVR